MRVYLRYDFQAEKAHAKDAIAPFRRVSSVSSQRPSSKAVFPANVSRAVFIFVFATFLQDKRARIEVFVFVPDHSYCLWQADSYFTRVISNTELVRYIGSQI